MSTHWYDFLKTGRIDRFDTLYELEQDRAPAHLTDRGEVARALATAENCEPKYNSRCMGSTPNGGKRLYSFETWGVMADVMSRYADEAEWVHLQRLDFRIEADIDQVKLMGFYAYAVEHRSRGRNVNSFNSREREKKEGRHAGGVGVSIGSHKSDIRAVVYKRKGEAGAIELQLSGKRLKDLVGTAVKLYREDPAGGTLRDRMLGLCRAALEKMARETGFESALALVRSVSPDAPQAPPSDFVAEAPVEMFVQTFMGLAPEEQSAALSRVLAAHSKSI